MTVKSGDQSILSVLTNVQITEFIEKGVVVVPNLLSKNEILQARHGLHEELKRYGVNHSDLETTGANLALLSSTGGAGGIIDLFYPSWRLKVAEHPSIFQAMTELWGATYAINHPKFTHPFGIFSANHGYIYMNRVCYRVPDTISKLHSQSKKSKRRSTLQRSLTPHVDCCPTTLFDSKKEFPRWRPIQCITVLTDNTVPNTGGFECVPGFCHEFNDYFQSNPPSETTTRDTVCLGDFSPLRMQEDRNIIHRYQHIPCNAGDVIFFDWRTPHANSYKHEGTIPREVIYTGFLPATERNKIFAKEQLRRYELGLLPSDHWQKESQHVQIKDIDTEKYNFSPLGRKLMGIDPWV